MGVIAQGTTISGLVTGTIKSFTTPEQSSDPVDITSLADTQRKFTASNLFDGGEFSIDLIYASAPPAITATGTGSLFTITFPDASTVSAKGIVTKVGGITGSVGSTDPLLVKVTIKVTGAA